MASPPLASAPRYRPLPLPAPWAPCPAPACWPLPSPAPWPPVSSVPRVPSRPSSPPRVLGGPLVPSPGPAPAHRLGSPSPALSPVARLPGVFVPCPRVASALPALLACASSRRSSTPSPFLCAPVPCCGTHSVWGFGRPWRLPWPCVVAACGLLLCCPAVPSVPRPVPCRAGFLFACPARVALVVAPFLLELWVPSRRGSQGIWVPRPAGLAPRCPPSGSPPDAFPTQPLLAACPHSPLALRRRPACVPAALGGFVAGGRCPCRVALPCSGLARLPCPWLSAWLPVARLALRGACLPGVPAGPASPVPGPGARSPLVGVGLACLVVSSVALACSVLRPCF